MGRRASVHPLALAVQRRAVAAADRARVRIRGAGLSVTHTHNCGPDSVRIMRPCRSACDKSFRRLWSGLARPARAGEPAQSGRASARKLLPRLADSLGVRLPAASAVALDPHRRPAADVPDRAVACRLGELGAVSLDLVTKAEDRCRWEAMIGTHHPAGWRRPSGGQLRYWVRSERHGVLGGIGFAAAGIQLGPRDGVIGWSADSGGLPGAGGTGGGLTAAGG